MFFSIILKYLKLFRLLMFRDYLHEVSFLLKTY
jgi:hypothetical protein